MEPMAASALVTESYDTNPTKKRSYSVARMSVCICMKKAHTSLSRKKISIKQLRLKGKDYETLNVPNPLESEVFLSTKTLAEMTFPKGANNVAKSASVKSLGRW
jgi:hypothetical protein